MSLDESVCRPVDNVPLFCGTKRLRDWFPLCYEFLPPPANFSKLDSFPLYWIEFFCVCKKMFKLCSEVAHLFDTKFPSPPPPTP
jgi:hypothetical protein